MTIHEAIDAYLKDNYAPQWRDKVKDDVYAMLTDEGHKGRAWALHCLHYLSRRCSTVHI